MTTHRQKNVCVSSQKRTPHSRTNVYGIFPQSKSFNLFSVETKTPGTAQIQKVMYLRAMALTHSDHFWCCGWVQQESYPFYSCTANKESSDKVTRNMAATIFALTRRLNTVLGGGECRSSSGCGSRYCINHDMDEGDAITRIWQAREFRGLDGR